VGRYEWVGVKWEEHGDVEWRKEGMGGVETRSKGQIVYVQTSPHTHPSSIHPLIHIRDTSTQTSTNTHIPSTHPPSHTPHQHTQRAYLGQQLFVGGGYLRCVLQVTEIGVVALLPLA
jgi:hypothetical protein